MNEEKRMSKYFFEIAWEVVNKVGGIYTVIRTKAPVTVKELGSHYFMLGTYDPRFASTDVEVLSPDNPVLRDSINAMKANGVKVIYGKWLIDGYPHVILFDILSAYWNINEWRKELYEHTSIGIPDGDKECLDVLVFGAMCTWFLGEFKHRLPPSTLVTAHFHEWLSGVGLILCKKRKLDIALVFTTHATLLGRHLAASNADLYNHLDFFDVDKEAGDRQIYHKYCIERASAGLCDVFTTVSKITGDEATAFLKRKPDIITPNGLNIKKYTNYNFNVDNTVYFFCAGRYEFTNKGVDMFLEALARLNGILKWYNIDINVVAFLIFPAGTNNFNVESLKGQALFKQLKDTVSEIKSSIGKKLVDTLARGDLPDTKSLITNDEFMKLKKYLISSKRSFWAPISTHNISNDSNDPILSNLRRLQLINSPEDRVKVIFHPEFLNSTSPLFSIDYEEFVRGCHLGVFCSYYEPWGYTPAECTVMGIPSITSNLSGFGEYIQASLTNPSNFGIYIVDRRFCSFDESVDQLSDTRKQRIIQRNRTERVSEILDWRIMGRFYRKARNLALSRHNPHRTDLEQNSLSKELQRSLSVSQLSVDASNLDVDTSAFMDAYSDASDDE